MTNIGALKRELGAAKLQISALHQACLGNEGICGTIRSLDATVDAALRIVARDTEPSVGEVR